MRLLITGCVGSNGRHHCGACPVAGHDVPVMDVMLAQVHLAGRADLPLDVEFVDGDRRNKDVVRYQIGDAGRCFADISLANEALGFTARIEVAEGIGEGLQRPNEQPTEAGPDAPGEPAVHGFDGNVQR